jgi:hypothetical protein
MINDWKTEIAVAWKVLQAVQDADREGLWSYHLPRVAASEQELRDTERILGFGIDPMYRAFLTYANGWPDFHHSAWAAVARLTPRSRRVIRAAAAGL